MLKFEISGYQFKDHQLRKHKFQVASSIALRYKLNETFSEKIPGSAGSENEWLMGRLYRLGYIQSPQDIQSINRDSNGVLSVSIPSLPSPVPSPSPNPFKITPYQLLGLTATFHEKSILYKDTGTAHSTALASVDDLGPVYNDIYRLNAFDKAIGYHLNHTHHHPVLLLSGKICESVVQVAASIGIQLIISRSAPIKAAIEIAKQHNQTIVGFARGPRFSIFGNNHHIVG